MNEAGAPRQRIGEYEILTRLNSGGMGEVYLVRRTAEQRFEKLAAIKIIRSDIPDDEQTRTMFFDEARLMARISHPTISQVYDFGREENRFFLVMEYVPGVSFSDLSRHRPPPIIAARAAAEVCLGLHAAHQLTDFSGKPLGVVHRDVSPQNLILTFEGCVKILDFGIALMRDRETQATQFGVIKGKPAYMAPEQVKNETVDRRTDVFAVSIVLHELLTGCKLFTGDSIYAIAHSIEQAKIHPPSAVVGPLPAGLDRVVLRGLERDPARRFQTAQEMAQALEQVVAATPGETLPQYAARELAQEHRRHREWLQSLVTGAVQAAPPCRPAGVATAQIADLAADARSTVRETPPAAGRTGLRKSRRSLWVASLVLIVLGAGLAWLLPRLLGSPAMTPPPVPSAVEKPAAVQEMPVTPAVREQKETGREPVKPKKAPRNPRSRKASEVKPAPPPPPDPVPQKESVAPPALALITIAAHPFANVRIDGKEMGTTPILDLTLPAGEHRITLISPDDGIVRLEQKVNLAEGEHKKLVFR